MQKVLSELRKRCIGWLYLDRLFSRSKTWEKLGLKTPGFWPCFTLFWVLSPLKSLGLPPDPSDCGSECRGFKSHLPPQSSWLKIGSLVLHRRLTSLRCQEVAPRTSRG